MKNKYIKLNCRHLLNAGKTAVKCITVSGLVRLTYFLLFFIMTFQFVSCSSGDKTQFYRAVERADVDVEDGRAGLIRTVYCDIYIEYADRDSWNYLKGVNLFKGSGRGYPIDPCFHFVIVNTWNKPFTVEKVEVIYNGGVIPSENFNFIKDKNYLESRYSLNIPALLKKRRIFTDRYLIQDIDFENDSTEYRLNFIAPGDRISFFSFFQRIPSGKSPKVRVGIKYFDMKKVIDFDIGRFDYNEIENMQL